MTLTYGSVCSGIEAASCAWHPLGFRPAWFAETASFPSRVLAERWPEVRNHGDFTSIVESDPIDVLVGGTPRCFGFADDYTLVRGSSDSSRYEALGNSMAVPVARWIGRRLQVVDGIVRSRDGLS